MKKWFERIGLWLLSSAILTTFTVPVYAAEAKQDMTTETFEVVSEVIINPLYQDVLDEAAIARELEERASRNAGIAAYSTEKVCSTVEEAEDYLRAQMVDRAESVTVVVPCEYDANNYQFVFRELSREIFYGAMEYSNSCSGQEGDALARGWAGVQFSGEYGSHNLSITFALSYYTTREQEEELTAAVNNALDEMQLEGLSEYEKVLKIHDYICDHVDYDYENLEDDTYTLKYSAYAAIINGTAVCQGYAVLFYRMCKDVGLSVRYISGKGNGGNHGWNIVRIGSVYYNVDCTWDGQDSTLRHTWFLKSEEDFPDHTRNAEYNTAEFHQEFSMSAESWTGSGVNGSGQVVVVPKLTFASNNVSMYIKSSYVPKVYLDNKQQTDGSLFYWSSNNDKVATVDSKGTISSIAAGTATITCTLKEDKEVSAAMQLTVMAKKVEQIKLSQTSLQMEKGNSVNLTATITPKESDWTVKWTSSDTKVASVDSNGKVTAIGAGTATVMVTAQDGSGVSASCTVSVKAAQTNQSGGSPHESSQATAASTTMFRLYNPNSGEHFYTGSAVERDQLVEVGWKYEGTAWRGPTVSNTPVYRLYNSNAGDHHYTTSTEEKDNLVAVGWTFEGVGWYSDDELGIPLYRLYNPNAMSGSHHYTASAEERDNLVKVGWKYEGIAWYGMR